MWPPAPGRADARGRLPFPFPARRVSQQPAPPAAPRARLAGACGSTWSSLPCRTRRGWAWRPVRRAQARDVLLLYIGVLPCSWPRWRACPPALPCQGRASCDRRAARAAGRRVGMNKKRVAAPLSRGRPRPAARGARRGQSQTHLLQEAHFPALGRAGARGRPPFPERRVLHLTRRAARAAGRLNSTLAGIRALRRHPAALSGAGPGLAARAARRGQAPERAPCRELAFRSFEALPRLRPRACLRRVRF